MFSRIESTQDGLQHTPMMMKWELKLYQCKLQMHQEINDLQAQNGIQIARFCRSELRNFLKFFNRVIFSEEYKLSLSWVVNQQNYRALGSERPNKVRQVPNTGPSVTVWGAKPIGPYFLKIRTWLETLTEGFLGSVRFQNWESTIRPIFQQDGASLYFSLLVRHYLNQ